MNKLSPDHIWAMATPSPLLWAHLDKGFWNQLNTITTSPAQGSTGARGRRCPTEVGSRDRAGEGHFYSILWLPHRRRLLPEGKHSLQTLDWVPALLLALSLTGCEFPVAQCCF